MSTINASATLQPDWYTEPAQALSGFALDYLDQMTGEGGYLEGYNQPRIAGWDQYQSGAYDLAGSLVGASTPYIQAGGDIMQSGVGGLNSALAMAGNTGSYLKNAQGVFNKAEGMIGSEDQYLKQGAGALQQAQQILAEAGIFDPAEVQKYLSPYLSGVNDEIARLGNENLLQNILPELNSTFVGAGQFGSTRNADFTNDAIARTQREVLGTQSKAMNDAWKFANDTYLNWDKNRQGAAEGFINSANAFGNLGATKVSALNAATNLGQGIGTLGNVNTNAANVAGNIANNIVDAGEAFGQYGIDAVESNWNDLGKLFQMGDQYQDYNQSILDTAYDDWMSRWTTPIDMIGGLKNLIPNPATSTTGSTSSVTPDTSLTEDIISAILAGL